MNLRKGTWFYKLLMFSYGGYYRAKPPTNGCNILGRLGLSIAAVIAVAGGVVAIVGVALMCLLLLTSPFFHELSLLGSMAVSTMWVSVGMMLLGITKQYESVLSETIWGKHIFGTCSNKVASTTSTTTTWFENGKIVYRSIKERFCPIVTWID